MDYQPQAFCDALALRPGELLAIVGGGGKTTALYRLGAELAARGLPVLLTGTARFTPPDDAPLPPLALVADEAALHAALAGAAAWPLVAASGWGSKGRLLPLDPAWLDRLHAARPELTIIAEADGSAMRPFKAPGAAEPVIPAAATTVLHVVGLDVLGRPLDERAVHRPDRVAALTGAQPGDRVTAEMVAAVLAHPDGGGKGVPSGARRAVLLNKAETPERRSAANVIVARIQTVTNRAIIGLLKRDPPVLAVVTTPDGEQ